MGNVATLVAVEELPGDGVQIPMEALQRLRRLACTPGAIDLLMASIDNLDKFNGICGRLTGSCDKIDTLEKTIQAVEKLCQHLMCPGNTNYSQVTLDKQSNESQVNLDQIVKGMGGNFVDQFSVGPGKSIRLTHNARPGYTPEKIAIDLNLANNGNNYLDIVLQFRLVPIGTPTALGTEVGSLMRGNQFLNKDGTQIHVKFPEHRGCPINIGSLESLVLDVTHSGQSNNIDSTFVTVYYNNRAFYEMCKRSCGVAPGACGTGC